MKRPWRCTTTPVRGAKGRCATAWPRTPVIVDAAVAHGLNARREAASLVPRCGARVRRFRWSCAESGVETARLMTYRALLDGDIAPPRRAPRRGARALVTRGTIGSSSKRRHSPAARPARGGRSDEQHRGAGSTTGTRGRKLDSSLRFSRIGRTAAGIAVGRATFRALRHGVRGSARAAARRRGAAERLSRKELRRVTATSGSQVWPPCSRRAPAAARARRRGVRSEERIHAPRRDEVDEPTTNEPAPRTRPALGRGTRGARLHGAAARRRRRAVQGNGVGGDGDHTPAKRGPAYARARLSPTRAPAPRACGRGGAQHTRRVLFPARPRIKSRRSARP